jgi:hypothetical protein
VIDPSQPLTITTNAFSAYGSHQDDGIGIGIAGGSFVIPFSSVAPFGCGWCVARQSHSAVPDTNFLSYTVPAFSFASGQDYFIVAGFTALVDVNPNPALPGSQNVAYYSAHTILTLSAANPPAPPTPSTPLPPPTTDQSAYTASGGRIPATAVQVNATGTFGNASLSVILDIGQALQTTLATGLEVASTYNVYVVALVPGERLGSASPVWYVKPRAPGSWSPLQFPIAAFLENAAEGAANNQVLIEILIGNDLSSLVGTEFYIGYGLSDQEMLAAGRYRGVYKAQ